jgi:predicted RND superfamily exporter protein
MTFSFVVLMIVTRNFIASICSIFCVTVIITSIITFMHWDGQQFGSNQSIAVVMLIGFAVDYVLHLSTDYMHSSQPTRALKMQQSYREMGVSIFSGCITTFFCGFFLYFASFVFFKTFAFVISLTVIMAFFFSMVTFGALMHLVGPEKDFCTIKMPQGSK